MHGKSTLLGIVVGVIIATSFVGCTVNIEPQQQKQRIFFRHDGTLPIVMDGEVDEEYEFRATIEIIQEGTEAKSAAMILGGVDASGNKGFHILAKENWAVKHEPIDPDATPKPIVLPTFEPRATPEPAVEATRTLLENGVTVQFMNTTPVKLVNALGQVVDADIRITGMYTNTNFTNFHIDFIHHVIVTVTPTPDSRQAYSSW